ncbi:MAG TPA: 6,7-dimethyl-8-ribityllumazine synthase [Methylomirabilota bacterium]|nr:6,7-dimethyl-8-ribityllumazine synthase [Methylomirabilota bacterium]
MSGRAPHGPGRSSSSKKRIGIIAARFHEPISKKLVDGAIVALRHHGVPEEQITISWVPGSFELPFAAMALARSRRFDALVCLGVVIRGETPHFEHVARVAADGISHVGLATGVPVTFGVITAENESQAWERAGGIAGNRGEDAALAALEMAHFSAPKIRRQRGRR